MAASPNLSVGTRNGVPYFYAFRPRLRRTGSQRTAQGNATRMQTSTLSSHNCTFRHRLPQPGGPRSNLNSAEKLQVAVLTCRHLSMPSINGSIVHKVRSRQFGKQPRRLYDEVLHCRLTRGWRVPERLPVVIWTSQHLVLQGAAASAVSYRVSGGRKQSSSRQDCGELISSLGLAMVFHSLFQMLQVALCWVLRPTGIICSRIVRLKGITCRYGASTFQRDHEHYEQLTALNSHQRYTAGMELPLGPASQTFGQYQAV